MKFSAIAQRGFCKDFVDLYELVFQKHRLSMENLVQQLIGIIA